MHEDRERTCSYIKAQKKEHQRYRHWKNTAFKNNESIENISVMVQHILHMILTFQQQEGNEEMFSVFRTLSHLNLDGILDNYHNNKFK